MTSVQYKSNSMTMGNMRGPNRSRVDNSAQNSPTLAYVNSAMNVSVRQSLKSSGRQVNIVGAASNIRAMSSKGMRSLNQARGS